MLITVFAFTVIFVLLIVTFYLATELKNVRQERDQLQQERDQLQLSRPSDTGESVRKMVATLEEKSELEKRVISLENEKRTLEQENIRLKTQYVSNEADALRTKDENLFQLHRLNSELEKQVAVLQVQISNIERNISEGSHFSDEIDSNSIAPLCTNVAKLFTRITREIVECPESLTPIFCLKIVHTIVDCLVENVSCDTDQFKILMCNILRNSQKLYDVFVDKKKKQEQEQSKNLGKRSAAFDDDDEGGFTGMLDVAMEECLWSLDKLEDKLRELSVEVKDWVQDDRIQEVKDQVQEVEDQVQKVEDQVQETENQVQEMKDQLQVQETEDQVQEMKDQVQKAVDLDQEGDDL